MTNKIGSRNFYATYFGHHVEHLEQLLRGLRFQNKETFVYLAGDSSLDSKYWFADNSAAVNGYEHILEPPKMKQDIAYYINLRCALHQVPMACINCAVEEATLGEKEGGGDKKVYNSSGLNAQDLFIQRNITQNDVLFVNIGGNDIALRPTVSTIFNMCKLLWLNSQASMTDDFVNCWGAPYFIEMFSTQLRAYIMRLIKKRQPRKVVIGIIYYPSETPDGWAQTVLNKLSYFEKPQYLQLAIQQIYRHAVQTIRLPAPTVVETFPMYEVMNGKDAALYRQGVEPSPRGNEALADAVWPKLF
jgi:lysophospholipase L1-like esterase